MSAQLCVGTWTWIPVFVEHRTRNDLRNIINGTYKHIVFFLQHKRARNIWYYTQSTRTHINMQVPHMYLLYNVRVPRYITKVHIASSSVAVKLSRAGYRARLKTFYIRRPSHNVRFNWINLKWNIKIGFILFVC